MKETKEPIKPAPKYREELMNDCPPVEAMELDDQIGYRLVPSASGDQDHFRSDFFTLKKGCPNSVDPCHWRACSINLGDKGRQDLLDKAKLPRFDHMKFVAHLRVTKVSGRARQTGKGSHWSMWFYATFDPGAAVERFEPVR